MKKQILTLIIGILIGAILSTTVLLVIKGNQTQHNMPDMSNSSNMQNFDPSKINGDKSSTEDSSKTTDENKTSDSNTDENA